MFRSEGNLEDTSPSLCCVHLHYRMRQNSVKPTFCPPPCGPEGLLHDVKCVFVHILIGQFLETTPHRLELDVVGLVITDCGVKSAFDHHIRVVVSAPRDELLGLREARRRALSLNVVIPPTRERLIRTSSSHIR